MANPIQQLRHLLTRAHAFFALRRDGIIKFVGFFFAIPVLLLMILMLWILLTVGWAMLRDVWPRLEPTLNGPIGYVIAGVVFLYFLVKDARSNAEHRRWVRSRLADQGVSMPQPQRTTADRIHLLFHRVGVVLAGLLLVVIGIVVSVDLEAIISHGNILRLVALTALLLAFAYLIRECLAG
jgi:hypothetical protein